jgi:hypothetical protein
MANTIQLKCFDHLNSWVIKQDYDSHITAYFNGTPFHFPFLSSPKKTFGLLEEASNDYDKHTKEDDIEFYYERMEYYEKEASKFAVNRILSTKKINKLAIHLGFEDDSRFLIECNLLIYHLLKHQRIPDNRRFGFEIRLISLNSLSSDILSSDILSKMIKIENEELTKQRKTCGLCSQPATQLCGICKKIYYCCREHQKSHWKEHKTICKS